MVDYSLLFKGLDAHDLGSNASRAAAGYNALFGDPQEKALMAERIKAQQIQNDQAPVRNALLSEQLIASQASNDAIPIQNSLLSSRSSAASSEANQKQAEAELYQLALDAVPINAYLNSGNIDGAIRALSVRADREKASGSDPSDELDAIRRLQSGDVDSVKSDMDSVIDLANKTGIFRTNGFTQAPSGIREFDYLARQAGLGGSDRQKAARVSLGLDPRAIGSSQQTIAKEGLTDLVAESQSKISGESAGATARESTRSKSVEQRRAERIELGADAAKGIATISRGLELLKKVETGGVAGISLRIKNMLGVEGADEGELTNKLSKAVLAQLKEVFGAQFTAVEGARLERIEAGISKSTETNIRLLTELKEVAEMAAMTGMGEAEKIGDTDTANQIRSRLNYRFDPNNPAFPWDVQDVPSGPSSFTTSNGIQFTVE